MAQEETEQIRVSDVTEGSGPVFVPVPPEHAQTVVDLVARLNQQEEDVSGFMLSLGNFGGIGPVLRNVETSTVTHCRSTGGPGNDMLCDSDVLITNTGKDL
jgi:hypothetical protein